MSAVPDLREDLQALVESVTPSATEPLGVYVFAAADPGAALARYVESAVFLEVFGNSAEMLEKEYEPYEAASIFVCVIDHRRRCPAGMMRVMLPSSAGFKTFNDVAPVWGVGADEMVALTGIPLDARATWDIASLAVAPDYRGKAATGLVTLGLLQGLTTMAWNLGIDWFVAIFDVVVLRMIRWKLHMTFSCFTGVTAASYLGSPASVPAWCRLTEAKRRFTDVDPGLHDLLFEGVGLEAALRPLELGEAVERVAGISAAIRPPTRASGDGSGRHHLEGAASRPYGVGDLEESVRAHGT
jgi:hypothetical protein